MGQRLELQALLEELLGSSNVYFQPPNTFQMEYPCIVYQRDNARTEFADNKPYTFTNRYMVTVMDRNPDSLIPARVAAVPQCEFNRFYIAEGINHDAFTLYF